MMDIHGLMEPLVAKVFDQSPIGAIEKAMSTLPFMHRAAKLRRYDLRIDLHQPVDLNV